MLVGSYESVNRWPRRAQIAALCLCDDSGKPGKCGQREHLVGGSYATF